MNQTIRKQVNAMASPARTETYSRFVYRIDWLGGGEFHDQAIFLGDVEAYDEEQAARTALRIHRLETNSPDYRVAVQRLGPVD